MPKKKIYSYEGSSLVVSWDRMRCIHAAECVHRLPAVFDPDRRPWIEPDRESAEEVARVVVQCPTGALHFTSPSGRRREPIPESNVARLVVDGPVYLSGDIELKSPDGTTESENRVALCRCGASQNKPFCDNSHVDASFSDRGELGAPMLGRSDESGSAVQSIEISTVENGPVLLRGPIEIRSADGSDTHRGAKVALCRCGESRNRPYCDGSHAAAGFGAE